MFQYSQHLFSRDYTSSFCICFSSIALFYTAHFPCSPPVPNFHTATAIHLICISSHHMAAFYTIPRHSSSVRQQLSHSSFSHSFTHTYFFSINHSFFTHSLTHSFSHASSSSPTLLSPTAANSQHRRSSLLPLTLLSLLSLSALAPLALSCLCHHSLCLVTFSSLLSPLSLLTENPGQLQVVFQGYTQTQNLR